MPWVEAEEYDEEFIGFIKNYDLQSKPQVMELLEKYSFKDIYIFKERNEADDFLLQIKQKDKLRGVTYEKK